MFSVVNQINCVIAAKYNWLLLPLLLGGRAASPFHLPHVLTTNDAMHASYGLMHERTQGGRETDKTYSADGMFSKNNTEQVMVLRTASRLARKRLCADAAILDVCIYNPESWRRRKSADCGVRGRNDYSTLIIRRQESHPATISKRASASQFCTTVKHGG